MQHYHELGKVSRDGFDIVIDRTYEETRISDNFDDSCHDIAEMERKVNNGECDWFMLRARAMLKGIVFGQHTLGGLYYDSDKIEDVLTDGSAEMCIYEAVKEAVERLDDLLPTFKKIVDDHTYNGRVTVL